MVEKKNNSSSREPDDADKPDSATPPDPEGTEPKPAAPDPAETLVKPLGPGASPTAELGIEAEVADKPPAEEDVPAEWEPGMVILDTYEVKEELGHGGFGTVHKVHHKGWNVDLAVKSALGHVSQEEILREAEVWMELGLHPNIVSCHFVRTLGGIPRIFVEYAEGGTLADWLYGKKETDEDGRERATEQPRELTRAQRLGIAIEICRGMQHAHSFEWTDREERKHVGLVHRDLKPLNVLMTADGVPRITDFGLVGLGAASTGHPAGDRSPADTAPVDQEPHGDSHIEDTLIKPATDQSVPNAGEGKTQSSLIGGRPGTPAYTAPEQWDPHAVTTKAADIYAFGVILYEIFCGRRPFVLPEKYRYADKALIPAIFEELHCKQEPPDPVFISPEIDAKLSALMLECLAKNPQDRPASFAEVNDQLKAIYQRLEQESYDDLRPEPKAAELLADSLNNRALSYLEIGQPNQPEELWEEALKADPHHPESTYNRGLLEWRSGRLTDVSLIKQLNQARGTYPRANYLLGLIHLERGDVEAALSSLKEAQQTDPDNLAVNAAIHDATQLASTIRPVSRTLAGLNGPITGITFCSGGKTLLSASWDQTVRKWAVGPATCLDVLSVPAKETFVFAASPSGRIAVTAGKEQALCVWDIDSGNCRHALQEPNGSITCVAVHPSGSACISAGTNGILNVWDLDTGERTHGLRGHGGAVSSVAFCKDGHLAASAGADGTLRVWDWNTKTCCRVIERLAARVNVMVAHNEVAMLGTVGGMIELWDVIVGKCLGTLSVHTGPVLSVSISASGSLALSTGLDNTVRLWDLQHGRCLRTLESQSIYAGALSPDASMMAWGEKSKTVWSDWDIRVGSTACSAEQPLAISRPKASADVYCDEDRIQQLQVRVESKLASGGAQEAYEAAMEMLRISGHERDRRALEIIARVGPMGRRTRARDGWLARVFCGHEAPVACATFSPDARAIVSGAWDGTVRVWDSNGEKPTRVFRDHVGPVSSVAVSMDGLAIVSGGWDGTLRFRSVALKLDLGALVAPNEPVSTMAVSSDHRCAVTGGGSLALANDLQAHKRDADQLKLIWASLTQSAGPVAAALNNRRPRCDTDYNVRVWDLMATGKCVHVLAGHTGRVRDIVITRDSRCAVSVGEDGSVRMWDLVAGRGSIVVDKRGQVFGVALTPDETRIWVALEWGTVTEIDLAQRQPLRSMRPESKPDGLSVEGVEHATSVAVSSDGRSIAVGYQDGTIRIWGTENGECELVLRGHTGWVSKLDFSRDNRWLASAGGDCTVRLWEVLSDFDFPRTADWDDGASGFLRIFLASHSRGGKGVMASFGKPAWTPKHFEALIQELRHRGYGWLRPEGVRRKLEEMTANWWGPPPLPGEPADLRDAGSRTQPETQARERIRVDLGAASTTAVAPTPDKPTAPRKRLDDAEKTLIKPSALERKKQTGAAVPKCRNCGRAAAPDARFCVHCGKPLSERRGTPVGTERPATRGVVCACGSRNPPGNAFCNQCGRPLEDSVTPRCAHCGKTVPGMSKFCVHCGRRLTD